MFGAYICLYSIIGPGARGNENWFTSGSRHECEFLLSHHVSLQFDTVVFRSHFEYFSYVDKD